MSGGLLAFKGCSRECHFPNSIATKLPWLQFITSYLCAGKTH